MSNFQIHGPTSMMVLHLTSNCNNFLSSKSLYFAPFNQLFFRLKMSHEVLSAEISSRLQSNSAKMLSSSRCYLVQ